MPPYRTDFNRVHEYITAVMGKIVRLPTEFLPYPYLSITADETIYGTTVFCWDNHFMALRYAYDRRPEFFRYLVDNLLKYQRRNGFVPNCVNKDTGSSFHSLKRFHAQPYMMQSAFFYYQASRDLSWIGKTFRKLERYLDYYEKTCRDPSGLFAWPETYMSGIDNDIATTFFPPGTMLAPDLNARIYLEYKAAALLSAPLGAPDKARRYAHQAAALKERINAVLWNPEFQIYTAVDRRTGRSIFRYEEKPLNDIGIGHYSFCSCSNFIPLYAGLAAPEAAISMIRKYLLAPEHFYGEYGIRSLSKASEYYNNAVWGNAPRFGDMTTLTTSNWQGPVWILNCYLVANLLINYGFLEAARELNDRTLKLLSGSLADCGSFAENYDAETGRPLYARQFTSWNLLADIVADEIENPARRIITPLL